MWLKISLSFSIAIFYSVLVWWRTTPSLADQSSFTSRSSVGGAISPIETERLDNNNNHELSSTRKMQHRNLEERRTSSSESPMRILMGIFTTNTEEDTNRRRLIRKTYLQTYQILREVGLTSDVETPGSLCSLADLLENKGHAMETCSIVYAFVMGAWDKSNTTAPTDLTLFEDESVTYTVDRSFSEDYERDVVYLNIRENMNFGKSETWLRYASTILPRTTKLGIDLISKVDSDTVVSPRQLLSDLASSVFTQDRIKHLSVTGVYGGASEVGRSNQVHYMQGGFYFFSLDVARHITSKSCPRSQIIQEKRFDRGFERSEDVDIGNFVAYCWEQPKEAHDGNFPGGHQDQGGIKEKSAQHDAQPSEGNRKGRNLKRVLVSGIVHGYIYKQAARFRVKWKEVLARDMAILRFEQIKDKFGGHCPSEGQDRDEVLNWFDRQPNMKLARS